MMRRAALLTAVLALWLTLAGRTATRADWVFYVQYAWDMPRYLSGTNCRLGIIVVWQGPPLMHGGCGVADPRACRVG